MAKFHVKLKITGFELEIDGTRDEVPVIGHAIGQQLAGFLAPAAEMADGEIPPQPVTTVSTPAVDAKRTTRRKNRPAAVPSTSETNEAAVDWLHDVSKYGTPQQAWTTAEKSVWVVYVAGEVAGVSQMSAKQIALTFNKHFRTSGPIRANNISRDLAKLKQTSGKESPVGQDTTKTPALWFLTDAGRRFAQALITRGTTTAA
jgi:hypothetical protein